MRVKAEQVECYTCGVDPTMCCRNGKDHRVLYFHLQRQLLWILRQTEPWSNLLGKGDPGYKEEQTRLRKLLNEWLKPELEEHRKYIQTTAQRVTVMDFVQEVEEL